MFKQFQVNPNFTHTKIYTPKPARSAYIGLALLATAASMSMVSNPVQAASATWSVEQILNNTTGAYNIRTAVNASGRSVVVWDETVLGVGNTYGGTGIQQIYASVCDAQPVPFSPICSAPQLFTNDTTEATNAGAVVSPSGTVTVFWNWYNSPTGPVSEFSSSIDGGNSWSPTEQIPGVPGYTLMAGVYPEVGPSVGVDGTGNIIVAVTNPRTYPISPGSSFSVKFLARAADGSWSAPSQPSSGAGIFGSAKLFVNSDGQALLNLGFTTFRRNTQGNWSEPQTVSTAGMGQIYSASAGLDAGGKAYFVYRTRYSGAFLSTSTPTTGWTTPKHIAKFDTLGSSLLVRGSSAGHAIVYGNDMNTGNVRATVTANGGAAWGNLVNFGFGDTPQAVGSENGHFALSWSSGGVNWDRYFVASGSGIGTGTAAWVKNNLAGNNASGPVAIAGDVPGGNAQIVAGWLRWTNGGDIIGASQGTVAP